MSQNNPNQNRKSGSHQPEGERSGFPGMNIPEGKGPRSSDEVADARKRNVEAGKEKKAESEKKRPF